MSAIQNAVKSFKTFFVEESPEIPRQKAQIKIQSDVKSKEKMHAANPNVSGLSEKSHEYSPMLNTASKIHVVRGLEYLSDSGQKLAQAVDRLKQGQTILVDFSQNKEDEQKRLFDVLYGAILALDGSYLLVDNDGKYILFSREENEITDELAAEALA